MFLIKIKPFEIKPIEISTHILEEKYAITAISLRNGDWVQIDNNDLVLPLSNAELFPYGKEAIQEKN